MTSQAFFGFLCWIVAATDTPSVDTRQPNHSFVWSLWCFDPSTLFRLRTELHIWSDTCSRSITGSFCWWRLQRCVVVLLRSKRMDWYWSMMGERNKPTSKRQRSTCSFHPPRWSIRLFFHSCCCCGVGTVSHKGTHVSHNPTGCIAQFYIILYLDYLITYTRYYPWNQKTNPTHHPWQSCNVTWLDWHKHETFPFDFYQCDSSLAVRT